MANKKILLGLTTTPDSDWREKIREIDRFGLTEVALFPTYLKTAERKELYNLLEKTGLKNIPHVHARGEDMDLAEMDYLCQKYKTQVFNVHSIQDYPINFDYSKYKIFLENTNSIPTEEELKKYTGLCIDFAHWENGLKTKNKAYDNFKELVEKYSVGCCHVSAFSENLFPYSYCPPSYDKHVMENINEMDYIKKYLQYLPDIISIELANSFAQQLKVKEYLEKIINS